MNRKSKELLEEIETRLPLEMHHDTNVKTEIQNIKSTRRTKDRLGSIKNLLEIFKKGKESAANKREVDSTPEEHTKDFDDVIHFAEKLHKSEKQRSMSMGM